MSNEPCTNSETYNIAQGWGYRQVKTRCGNTKTDGTRAICETCRDNQAKMREIERQERNVAADNAWAHSAGWGDF